MKKDTKDTYAIDKNDLIIIGNIIKICSERGAFRANEFTVVGGIFNKISELLGESAVAQPVPEVQADVVDFPQKETGGPTFPL